MPKKIVKKQEDLELKNNKERDNVYNAFNNEQKAMFESIHNNIFTYCEAKAGTGKTLVTVAAMVNLLADNKISKIIYIQKPSERYLSQGYLPGTMDEKEQFLFTPLYDALTTLGMFDGQIQFMLDKGMLELKSDSALRGVNFKNAGIIIDEAENMGYHTLKLIFTRCDDECHVCMIGDSKQKDNHRNNKDFIPYGDYLASFSFGNKITLTKNYRGKFSKTAEDFTLED